MATKTCCWKSPVAPGAQFIGDRADLTELLGNLLDNACKWADRACGSKVGIDENAGSRSALRLTIEDDGPGIAEADRARVLTRGGRADEATPGHGIGLAMVHDTVALYGGTMRIDSSRSAARASSSTYPAQQNGEPLCPPTGLP